MLHPRRFGGLLAVLRTESAVCYTVAVHVSEVPIRRRAGGTACR